MPYAYEQCFDLALKLLRFTYTSAVSKFELQPRPLFLLPVEVEAEIEVSFRTPDSEKTHQ